MPPKPMELYLSPAQTQALILMLSRMSFNHYLALTDGDEEQAYVFQEAATTLKKGLNE